MSIYSDLTGTKLYTPVYVNRHLKAITSKYNIIFANFHNSLLGIGGVGTVTRSMNGFLNSMQMVCYDPSYIQTNEQKNNIHCVQINSKLITQYQHVYMKQYIWPLLHSLHSDIAVDHLKTLRQSYKDVSQIFANKLVELTKDSEKPWIYWINDYSLAGVVDYLRLIKPSALIAFSLRSPFGYMSKPHFTKEDNELIVSSISKADFVSFHRLKDLVHFMMASEKISSLSVDWEKYTVQNNGHTMIPRVVPMGNDPRYRNQISTSFESTQMKQKILNISRGRKIISSISRIELHKGILEELELIEKFIKLFPNMKKSFVYIRVMNISKDYLQIREYRNLVKTILKRVDEINSIFGEKDNKSIEVLMDGPLNDHEISGLLRATDLLLIFSLADGFNHSALEGPLSKTDADQPMQLLLSDVGASDHLPIGTIHVDARDIVGSACTLYRCLNESPKTIYKRFHHLKESANQLSVSTWSMQILESTIQKKQIIKSMELKNDTLD